MEKILHFLKMKYKPSSENRDPFLLLFEQLLSTSYISLFEINAEVVTEVAEKLLEVTITSRHFELKNSKSKKKKESEKSIVAQIN
jgi:hypothetical protein